MQRRDVRNHQCEARWRRSHRLHGSSARHAEGLPGPGRLAQRTSTRFTMMHGPQRIHYQPRSGASYEAPLDLLVPALMRMRNCKDSLQMLVLLDTLPEMLLPALAQAASQKNYPAVAVKTIIKYCGPAYLDRTLGKERARSLRARYADREVISGWEVCSLTKITEMPINKG